jgi:hypothetical protein
MDAGVGTVILLSRATWELHGLIEKAWIRGALGDGADEHIKEEFCVARSRGALGMELNAKVRLVDMHDTFVAAIIGIDKEFLPSGRKTCGIDGETVVLGCDVAFAGHHAGAGDVVSAVSKLHLGGLGSGGPGKQLVAKANTKDRRAVRGKGLRDALNSCLHYGRVTRAVRDEQAIIFVTGKRWEVVIPGAHEHLDTTFEEAPQLVVLHADIDAEDTDRAARGVLKSRSLRWAVQFGDLDRY